MHRARANARHNHTKLMKNTKNRTKKMKFVRYEVFLPLHATKYIEPPICLLSDEEGDPEN